MLPDKKILCCYHHPCLDGSVAAWLFHKKFGDTAEYMGVSHLPNNNLPEVLLASKAEHIYFIDYAVTGSALRDLLEGAHKSVTIWDHHLSAFEKIGNYKHPKLDFNFVPDQSGAGIAFRKLFAASPVPDFIKLIEDIDLDRVELCCGREALHFKAAAYLDSFPLSDFNDTIKMLDEVSVLSIEQLAKLGETHHAKILKEVEKALQHVRFVTADLHPQLLSEQVPLIYCDVKDLGRELTPTIMRQCKNAKVAIAYFEEDGYIRLNIRSDGKIKANEIASYVAKKYGVNGGGRDDAAVVRLHKEQFQKLFGSAQTF